ncbi:gluconate 5-dehydrogenase [Anaerosolibacter carboniphilus]|uniref:Gluconate 5-dehydrogenase n=1 Tax=Anaerosolibacter carboniphilus TaxID=1417629 RepID=A0A841KT48_9FIRM|nr:SDR family NAD(P)-dependent oxidoreductase [Anaerosolibacter carboniphilus]MBB6215328.1 gluconate 5-dehydrogenase [Anaerosolibacter carboniphilus]
MSIDLANFNIQKIYSLEGQTAIVTGGASGLGLAIIRCLVSAGAKVIVLSSRGPEEAAESLNEFGEEVVFYQFNVTDTDRTQEMVDRIIAEQGPISILINNAGNHCKKFIWEMSVEDYVSVLNVHLIGAFALTKALVPHMKTLNRGSIIFMASMASYIGQPQISGYATAKAGYLGLVHTLTAECAEFGIRVNAIAPGWIDTPMFRKATDNDPVRLAKIMGRIPAKTIGDPMDIGMCAAFLCSDAARYINGACIPVDGGGLIGF